MVTDGHTDGHTDIRTYGHTDIRTDRPSYRDARTHLKKPNFAEILLFLLLIGRKLLPLSTWPQVNSPTLSSITNVTSKICIVRPVIASKVCTAFHYIAN